jgi:hypothetical protein
MKRQVRGKKKERFIRQFRKRFLLRFHMSLILTATCLSGALFSKLLLFLSVRDPLIRLPVTTILSYLLFFLFIKLWLWYVSTTGWQKAGDTADAVAETGDVLSFPEELGGLHAMSATKAFAGEGGNFGGSGASGSFGEAAEAVAEATKEAGKSVGDKIGDLVPDLDEGAGFVLVALGVFLAVVFGAGLFLIYSAPAILSEAVFEFLLAGSLVKKSQRMDDPDWMGSVLRATWIPLAVVLTIALAAGWVLHAYYPEITRIADLLRRL